MNILVIDDSKLMRKMVSAIIADAGDQPYVASGAEQALLMLDKKNIELIFMDVEMPKMNGFELTRLIRSKKRSWIPIIFLTASTDDSHLTKGIESGGDDYIMKPINSVVLAAKIKAMARIVNMKKELDTVNRQLLRLTNVDALTGIMNRRGFNESLKRDWKNHTRERKEISMVFLDIDNFKAFNDNYGHQRGDECLKQFSAVINTQLKRPMDTLARYGGEEFVIILPNTTLDGAALIGSYIIDALADAKIEHQYSPVAPYLTASMGITSSRFSAKNENMFIQQADQAVYKAKKQGRNRYSVYEPL
ncbi:MAG: diguanylate cyclase [Oceanospirillaceae bacterium]|nr:diguanylate cyclase [Oceanospirillaceae bacterium]